MTNLSSRMLAALLLGVAMIAPAGAVDTIQSKDAPDLTAVRTKLKAADWKGAIVDLNELIDKGTQHADVYNLLGYSLRQSGDTTAALTFYKKALEFDPNHKGALEYLGELYVKIGDIPKARQNAATLTTLCPQGCEELEDLQRAIASASTKTN